MRAARMFVKTWRILTKLRTDPARATNLLRALLVLANLVVNRSRLATAAHQLHEHLRTLPHHHG
jgi:predicted ATP-grasp superfamily ATP-dependent carboligase